MGPVRTIHPTIRPRLFYRRENMLKVKIAIAIAAKLEIATRVSAE
jgi:hypothetical protein